MATSEQFNLKNTYNFNTYNPSYLGTFENVVVLGIVGIETASLYGDVVVQHMNLLSQLPVGSIRDPEKIEYILIKDPSGVTRAIGLPWIITNTVTLVERNKIVVEFEDVGPGDSEKIKLCLNSRGYGGKYTIKLV